MKRYILSFMGFIVTLFLYFVYQAFFIEKKEALTKESTSLIYENKATLRYPHLNKLHIGDIILRRMYEVDSNMACRFSEGEKRYSHVGMIVESQGEKKVLHILNERGMVLTGVKEFLHYTHVWAVYRYKESKPFIFNKIALSYLEKKITFDNQYDLKTKDELYCSEMLMNIVNTSLKKEYLKPTKYFAGRWFITISDTYDNNRTLLVERSHKLLV